MEFANESDDKVHKLLANCLNKQAFYVPSEEGL